MLNPAEHEIIFVYKVVKDLESIDHLCIKKKKKKTRFFMFFTLIFGDNFFLINFIKPCSR